MLPPDFPFHFPLLFFCSGLINFPPFLPSSISADLGTDVAVPPGVALAREAAESDPDRGSRLPTSTSLFASHRPDVAAAQSAEDEGQFSRSAPPPPRPPPPQRPPSSVLSPPRPPFAIQWIQSLPLLRRQMQDSLSLSLSPHRSLTVRVCP